MYISVLLYSQILPGKTSQAEMLPSWEAVCSVERTPLHIPLASSHNKKPTEEHLSSHRRAGNASYLGFGKRDGGDAEAAGAGGRQDGIVGAPAAPAGGEREPCGRRLPGPLGGPSDAVELRAEKGEKPFLQGEVAHFALPSSPQEAGSRFHR